MTAIVPPPIDPEQAAELARKAQEEQARQGSPMDGVGDVLEAGLDLIDLGTTVVGATGRTVAEAASGAVEIAGSVASGAADLAGSAASAVGDVVGSIGDVLSIFDGL